MQRLRMVPLVKVPDAFAARVLVARLGADGFVTQLRGGGIDGPYPFGAVEVLIPEGDLEAARELLLADEVESAFEEDEPPTTLRRMRPWMAVIVLFALILTTVARVLSLAS